MLWFDYHREGQIEDQDLTVVGVVEVVANNRELDYALLRLQGDASLADRHQVAIIRDRPELPRGTRLNIVQCPGAAR